MKNTGSPENTRILNRLLTLNYLRNHSTSSRTEIAQKIGLSKMTVSSIVNELINENYVIEIGEGKSMQNGGRKPIILSLNGKDHYVLGVDIGLTKIVVGIGNLKGQILFSAHDTTKDKKLDSIILQTKGIVNDLLANKDYDDILCVSISIGGIIDSNKGIISFSPDFGWRDVNFKENLEEILQLPVVINNCTRMMAIAEQYNEKSKKYKSFLYINIGHGIGSAIVIDGKIYDNHSEFGHIPITDKRIKCDCGKMGCLECVSSGNAIEKEANIVFGNENSLISAKRLAEMAIKGDENAKKIFNNAGKSLGKGIAIAANLLNVDAVIIGGGVAQAKDLFIDSMMEEFNKHTIDVIKESTEIEFSSLGMESALIGSISFALNRFIFDTLDSRPLMTSMEALLQA